MRRREIILVSREAPQDAVANSESCAGLIEGLRRGDPNAHALLWQIHSRQLHEYIARRIGGHDRDLAEELLIQTLVEATRNIRCFDAQKAVFIAWLFGIARRQVLLEMRHRHRHKSIPAGQMVSMDDQPENYGTEDMATALAAGIAAKEDVAKLHNCLSEIEMEVLMLHCVHEFSTREISQSLGRSERAVNSLLHRARQKARERLSENA
jgi:RNA polymerase sigma factor (sigma-70 family)